MEGSIINKLSRFLSCNPEAAACSIDLETLVTDSGGFLTGESIISASISYMKEGVETSIFISENDSAAEEMRILRELDAKLAEISPDIILGYNHTGYDIPLIMTKTRKLEHEDRTRNIEYFLGTAWCLDMKYLCAEDLYSYDGFYKVRKLDDVVNHEKYRNLDTFRAKDLVHVEGMNKGEAIKYLWLNDRDKFIKYSKGDTHDLMVLFNEISGKIE